MIKCNKCGVEKDEKEFYPRNKVCKICYKKSVLERQRTERGRELRAIYSKNYSKSKKGVIAREKSEENYKLKPSSQKKLLAKWAVKRAVKAGILEKLPCSVCGYGVVHAHHCDYDRQLDVIWFCARHHKEWHSKNGEGVNAE